MSKIKQNMSIRITPVLTRNAKLLKDKTKIQGNLMPSPSNCCKTRMKSEPNKSVKNVMNSGTQTDLSFKNIGPEIHNFVERKDELICQRDSIIEECAMLEKKLEGLDKELIKLKRDQRKCPKRLTRVSDNDSRDLREIVCASKIKENFLLFSDSHGRGMARIIGELSDNQYQGCGMVKPSAGFMSVIEGVINCDHGDRDLVILAGANDVYRSAPESIFKNLESVLKGIKARSIHICTIPCRFDLPLNHAINESIMLVNNDIKELVARVIIIDLYDMQTFCFSKYGVHLNRKGKYKLGKWILESLSRTRSEFLVGSDMNDNYRTQQPPGSFACFTSLVSDHLLVTEGDVRRSTDFGLEGLSGFCGFTTPVDELKKLEKFKGNDFVGCERGLSFGVISVSNELNYGDNRDNPVRRANCGGI